MQPGQTIEPGQDNSSKPPTELPPIEAVPTETEAQPMQAPTNPTTQVAAPFASQQSRKEWAPGPVDESLKSNINPANVEWTASEFIDHQKSSGWYLAVLAGGIILATILYFATGDIVTSVVVVIAAIMFSVIGARRPRTLTYRITDQGVQIGEKLYLYADIRSFSIIEEGAIHSIQLLPLKRFTPALSMYYPPEQEDTIADALADYIPHEEHSGDPVDRLMKRLRF